MKQCARKDCGKEIKPDNIVIYTAYGPHCSDECWRKTAVDIVEYDKQVFKPSPERGFEIWSEGFIATGSSGTARYHGRSVGSTFKDACDSFAAENPVFKAYYSPDRMTFWGCRLFDNYGDARVSFG